MKITISIPKPCHENWSEMTPDPGSKAGNQGRHCAQCDHVVADLTTATDAQLVALFTSDAKPKCARFDPAQLDRALGAAEQQKRHANPMHLAAFTSLVAVAAGHEALAQQGAPIRRLVGEVAITQPAPPPPIVMGKMMAPVQPDTVMKCSAITGDTVVMNEPEQEEILQRLELGNVHIRPEEEAIRDRSSFGEPSFALTPEDTIEVCGTVVDDRDGRPIAFAQVWSRDLSANATTDEQGSFRMRLAIADGERSVPLEIRARGYELISRTFMLGDAPEAPAPSPDASVALTSPVDPHDAMGITGFVTDKAKGARVSGLTVRVRGTAASVRCDANGAFFLSVPEGLAGKPVTLDVLDARRTLKTIALTAHAVPCCVPISLMHDQLPERGAPKTECQDVGTVRLLERRMLTGVCAVALEPSPPTTLQRVTAPVKNAWRKLTR